MKKDKTILIITVILFILFLAMSTNTSIVWNTPSKDVIFHPINSNAYFYANTSLTLNSISISSTVFTINSTGFNVSSSNRVNITIMEINNNPGVGDTAISFYADCSGGTVWFNLSGYTNGNRYNVSKDSVFVETVIVSGGLVSFSSSVWSSHLFDVIYYAGNNPPVISNPYPANNSHFISTSGSPINAYLSDSDGDTMNVTVWSNHTGSWVQYAGHSLWVAGGGDAWDGFMRDVPPVGTWNFLDTSSYSFSAWQPDGLRAAYDNITVTDDWDMTTDWTKYWWSVNCTDSYSWTNKTFCFKTGTIFDPVVTTNTSTGVEETNATIHGYLDDDGGEACNVSFQYGLTDSYGTNTSLETELLENNTLYSSGLRFDYFYDTTWMAQQFISDVRCIVNNVSMRLSRQGNPQYVIASIRQTDASGEPTGDDIGQGWTDISSITGAVPGEWVYVNLNQSVTIEKDTIYVLCARSLVGNPTTIRLRWQYKMENPYTDGIGRIFSVNNGVSWTIDPARSNDDYAFMTFGIKLLSSPIEFSYSLVGLNAGTLYHYRAVANNSNSTVYGGDMAFLTKPNATANLVVNNTHHSPDTLNLSWAKGDGANHTYVERNTDSSWSRGSGTLVYNNTGSYYNDTNLSMNTLYYYQAWSYTNWTYNPTTHQWSDSYAANSNTTDNVDPPYNGSSSYDVNNFRVNLTWDRGNNSNREIVVQNNNSYPTSPTDGWIRQNDTATFFNESITYGTYFTIWSYNTTSQYYSNTGLNIPWGVMSLSCFDENHPQNGLNFSIEISNSNFSTTYAATNLTNWHYIDLIDIPFGTGTIFLISSDGYEARTETHTTTPNVFYNFTFYLPPALPPGGSDDPIYDPNETYAEDYIIRVVGPLTEYGADPPIGSALVTVSKYINTTDDYEEIFSDTTAANGEVDIPLVPGTLYHIVVTHDDYYDADDHWTPTEIVFSDDRYRVIRMSPLIGEDVPGVDYDIFWDTITFTATMNDVDGLNGTLTITYSDSNLSTVNTQIYVYEYYNGTSTLMFTISNVSENSFTYTTGTINTTRVYDLVLYFNNTANFDVSSPVSIRVYNINTWSLRTPFDMGERITKIFGSFDLGWENLIAVALAIIILCMFGVHNTGIGILACGFTLGFASFLLSMLTGGFNVALVILIPVIVIIGGIYMLVKNPGGHL